LSRIVEINKFILLVSRKYTRPYLVQNNAYVSCQSRAFHVIVAEFKFRLSFPSSHANLFFRALNYHRMVMKSVLCRRDSQYIANKAGGAEYISKYASKSERILDRMVPYTPADESVMLMHAVRKKLMSMSMIMSHV
jgi:hypothetical protein